MNWVLAGLLGALGAGLHDAYELSVVLRARRNDVPDEWKQGPFLVATMLRLLSGAILAGVLGALDEVGPIGATLVGVLAPLGVQRFAAWSDIGMGRN